MELVKIRNAVPSDQSFIFSSFLKGLYYGNEFYRMIDKTSFMINYKKVLTSLLIKRECKVACLPDDDNALVGYCIFGSGILDYVFIKPTFRKFGIAKQLVPNDIHTYTHVTKIGKAIVPKDWKFDPFKI
jgi:hypothetical protein